MVLSHARAIGKKETWKVKAGPPIICSFKKTSLLFFHLARARGKEEKKGKETNGPILKERKYMEDGPLFS